jgi:hypothetical protein
VRTTLFLLCLVPACLPTKSVPVTCSADKECIAIDPSLHCDLSVNRCVPVVDGGTVLDGPISLDGPGTPVDAAGPADGAGDVAVTDAPVAGPGLEVAVDTRVPDASGTCGVNGDCLNPAKGFCVSGVCTGCTAGLCSSLIDGGAAVCATTGTSAGKCVECVGDGECSKTPAKGFCVNNTCTGCTASLCGGKVDGGAGLVCATTGAAAGQCVECVDNTGCTRDPAKGFCVSNACTGCQGAGANACSGAKPACAASGAAAGQCVECVDNSGCTANVAKSFCVSNACTGCTATLCAGRTDGKTACASAGTFAGQCVTCTSNAQCAGTTPICASATDTCRACASDGECSGIGLGVCMADGHCALDVEAIYVGTLGSATCSPSNSGTPQAPVCSLLAGVGLAKSGSKPVVIVRGTLAPASSTISVSSPLTIVGKSSAVLAPADPGADAITITSGEITLRNLTIQGTASPKTGIGIKASPDSGSTVTLHMDTCAVKDNPGGGILLNGAAFDIKNTTVTGNGPNANSTQWGGIFVQSLPSVGSSSLSLVNIQTNNGGGLTCSASTPIQGAGILSAGNINTVTQISPACNVTACTVASTSCGAQTTPQ